MVGATSAQEMDLTHEVKSNKEFTPISLQLWKP
jgi:hypothetical protein